MSADDAEPGALQNFDVPGSTQRSTLGARVGVSPFPDLDRRGEKKATVREQDFRDPVQQGDLLRLFQEEQQSNGYGCTEFSPEVVGLQRERALSRNTGE